MSGIAIVTSSGTDPGPPLALGGLVERLAADQVETYRRQPAELIGHYNREAVAVAGYRGRQLLELLQNADDAARDGGEVSLLIELRGRTLIVANTGAPFSARGLVSLVVSDCSPKQLDRNKFIGCKGLGFRSVLTWSDRPFISSGDLNVAFSHQRALTSVRDLAAANASLLDEVRRFENAEGRPPVPIMRFPFVPDGAYPDRVLAAEFRSQGYSTVIVLPLRDSTEQEDPAEELKAQMESLASESLLFCRHLTGVTLRGHKPRKWQILRQPLTDSSFEVVIDLDGTSELWTVHTRIGRLSQDVCGSEPQREYQTAIAVPQRVHEAPHRTLCVFFPTHDVLPISLAVHATLELSDDRNRLHDHPKNRAVLHALAVHVAEVLESEATAANPLRALKLIEGIERADQELERLGFPEALIESLSARRVFPRINGDLGPAEGSRRVPQDAWHSIVTPTHFGEVLNVRSDDNLTELLRRFKIEWFSQDELLERLENQAREMAPGDLGALVARFLTNGHLGSFPLSSLVLDSTGNLGDNNTTCFFNPSAPLPVTPAWAADIRFLHPEFQAALQEGAKNTPIRSIAALLDRRAAKVEEYRLETVARALVQRVHGGLEAEKPARVRDLLSWLFAASDGTMPVSVQLKIPVLDSNQAVCEPSTCYFGDTYPGGELLSRLYGQIEGLHFVAPPSELGLGDRPTAAVQTFLRDLGVRGEPKLVELPEPASSVFAKHVLESLPYPTTIRGFRCETVAEARRLCRETAVENAKVPDRWMDLLKKADPSLLIAFLRTAGNRYVAQDVDLDARFEARINGEHKCHPDSSIRVPSVVLWHLRTTAWIPGEDGKLHPPAEVILTASGSRLLHGLYFRPVLRYDDPHVVQAGGRLAVHSFLTRLGAIASLESIESEALYDLLLRLPTNDPEGKHAASIYRTLIETNVQVDDGPSRRRFFQSGKVWARHEGAGKYLPVAEVRYNATVTIPAQVESHLKLADLPRRKGTKLVQQILGVEPLAQSEVQLNIDPATTQFEPSSEDANAHFRAAVPFVYALRLARKLDEDEKERRLLSRAELRLCERVRIHTMLPGGEQRDIELAARGDSILVGETLYIVDQYDRTAASLVKFWQSVANLVAELLGTDVAAEVANVLRCRNVVEMEDVVRASFPNQADALLAQSRERFRRDDADSDADAEHVLHPPAPNPPSADESPADPEDDQPHPGEPPSEDSPLGLGASDTAFQLIQGPVPRPRKKRNLVISPVAAAKPRKDRLLASEEDTFAVAERFEELAEPRRFPIRVHHLRGSEAFGCDILGLSSEAALVRAREEGVVADASIVRFIEVKGRASRTGLVELSDNEFAKASDEAERYFLYRVYRDPEHRDHYELAILNDPVHSQAVRQVTRFDLAEGTGAEWYSLRGEEADHPPGESSEPPSASS